jgi:oligopeptide/dipeptide ABC transporter ATP-binding protein
MYAGQIVERGTVKEVFADTRMPYTLGLLKSLPRLDEQSRGQKLTQIEGQPPDMRIEPKGCPFYIRCPYRIDVCNEVMPPLELVPEGQADHFMRCWVDVRTGKPRPEAIAAEANLQRSAVR